jgi:hypothetical protein
VSPRTPRLGEMFFRLLAIALVGCVALSSEQGYAQESGNERSFPQSKAQVEKTVRQMQSNGRLPVLEGFANPTTHSLDHYQRGYYQSKFQVSSSPSGGSVVRVTVEVTAFYVDPSGAKSGYQLLPSNGRIEGDLLDQLSDQLAAYGPGSVRAAPAAEASVTAVPKRMAEPAPSSPVAASPAPASDEPSLSAPVPRLPEVRSGLSSSLAGSLADQEKASSKPGSSKAGSKKVVDDPNAGPLQTELNSLEEVLKSQAHPKNLVAVKNSGTPVVSSASLNAKTLFLATAHDEFEMLDFNQDWVHVKISGLSRGWIWRNNLEMPGNVPDGDASPSAGTAPTAATAFHVSREEIAPFPGDWEPLRNKSVKIVSVEQTDEKAKDLDPKLRLEFAKSVMDKDYSELAGKPQEMEGIVLIFDSADGGMIAATFPTLQRWKAGSISDAALWHQCYFDPPELSGAAPVAAAASR